jgi:hypothetical protein
VTLICLLSFHELNLLGDQTFWELNLIKIVVVIDWEFTYAAPADFVYSPPWWLLEAPECWSAGLSDWAVTYEPRLRTFLRVLETREEAAMQSGTLNQQQRLSQRMRES